MSHKKLSKYTVVAGGKSSRIVEFSKGEAELFVRNFIETHLSHAVLKAAGNMDIKAYFSDTKPIKEMLEGQISKLSTAFTQKVEALQKRIDGYTNEITGEIFPPLTGEEKIKAEEQISLLEKAAEEFTSAKKNVTDVEDDSDFNKENIDHAKDRVCETLQELIDKGLTSLTYKTTSNNDSSNTNNVQTLVLASEKKTAGTNLNKLRKWQFDKFEEEYMAEIYVGVYHEYKYAKTIKELFEMLNPVLQGFGADIELKPENYKLEGTEVIRTDGSNINVEQDIENALKAKDIKFKRINIDWHNKDFDMAEDPFEYGG